MKYIMTFMFMLIITPYAMSYGKVFPTRVPVNTFSSHCVVKTISKLAEFANLIVDVDNKRRILELREGINQAKHFTFRTMCGPTYAGFISKYSKKVWASDCFSIIPKDSLINNNYLYYLLKYTQDTLYKHQSGAAQPHVYSKDLQSLKIPIPCLEKQQEIIAYCDTNNNLIKQLENEIENNKLLAQQFIKSIIKNVGVDVDEM